MNSPERPRSELRNQLVLNLARDDVKEYVFGVLDKLATEYNIALLQMGHEPRFCRAGLAGSRARANRRKSG